ncbi:MAG: acyl carrier protein [Nitrospirales bacterium]|nr:acyl carrier protein [Nitrospirales bacterium]
MKDEEIFTATRRCIAETTGCREEEISLDSSVIDDIGADSLDLLDLVFRLEQEFGIRITRGEIELKARQTLPETDFEREGLLTPEAKKALKEALPEVDPARVDAISRKNDIPRLLTVRTFVRLVSSKLNGGAGEAGG